VDVEATATVADKIRAIICAQLHCEDAPDDATFESLGADSLDPIELAMTVEDEFAIEITDEAIPLTDTVGKAIALVEGEIAKKGDGNG
jgi:acyl carrier protein